MFASRFRFFDFPGLAFEVSFPCVLRSTIVELLIQTKEERWSFDSKTLARKFRVMCVPEPETTKSLVDRFQTYYWPAYYDLYT